MIEALTSLLPESGALISIVILAIIALALIFVGKKIAKVLTFIIAGLAVAFLVLIYLDPYLGGLLTIAAAAVGFIVGGLIGLFLLKLGIGIALGILAYYLALGLGADFIPSILIGLVLFAIGVILSDKILAVMTVILGGLLLVQVMAGIGLPLLAALAVSLVVSAVGLYVQLRKS
jgi:hypothetical protein